MSLCTPERFLKEINVRHQNWPAVTAINPASHTSKTRLYQSISTTFPLEVTYLVGLFYVPIFRRLVPQRRRISLNCFRISSNVATFSWIVNRRKTYSFAACGSFASLISNYDAFEKSCIYVESIIPSNITSPDVWNVVARH